MATRVTKQNRSRDPWWKRLATAYAVVAAVGATAVTLVVNSDKMVGLWQSYFLDLPENLRIGDEKLIITTVGVEGPVFAPTIEDYIVRINYVVSIDKRIRETECNYKFMGADTYGQMYALSYFKAPSFAIEVGVEASDQDLLITKLPIPSRDFVVFFRVECDGVTSNAITFTIPRKQTQSKAGLNRAG